MKLLIVAMALPLLVGCASINLQKESNNSIIAISMKSEGLGQKGYGATLTLQDTITKDTIVTQAFSPLSPHAVVQNIRPGVYLVKKIEIPVGRYIYSNSTKDIQDYFPVISVSSDKKYYIGDFNAYREIGAKNVLKVRLVSSEIPKELKSKIEEAGTGWSSGDFISVYPSPDSTLVVY